MKLYYVPHLKNQHGNGKELPKPWPANLYNKELSDNKLKDFVNYE